MRLSIVIPVLNEADCLENCLRRAHELHAEGLELQTIVVDGGSTDGTCDIARRLGAELLMAPRGRGEQLQTGVKAAEGEVILMLHADAWLEPDAALQIQEAVRDPKIVCGAFHQRIEAEGLLYRLLERGNAWRVRWLALPYGDQGIFVRRSELLRVGGVPPMPLMEDVALMRRLGQQTRPKLLPGPLHVSARRWERHGVLWQTLRNWMTLAAYGMGVSAERLAAWYDDKATCPGDASGKQPGANQTEAKQTEAKN